MALALAQQNLDRGAITAPQFQGLADRLMDLLGIALAVQQKHLYQLAGALALAQALAQLRPESIIERGLGARLAPLVQGH